MLFDYKAKNPKGETMEGTVEAINQSVAIDVLSKRDLIIISLKESGAVPFWQKSINISFLNRAKPKDMVFLSRQLSVMVTAGLPLVKALEILSRQTSQPYLRGVISSISEDVRGGTRFSSSLAKYPKVFDDFYINMVRAGETAGKLDEVLKYLADEMEKNYDLMSKIRGSMIYPIFVVGAVIAVMILMMIFVIPQLTQILEESEVALPVATQILIATSKFLKNNVILMLIGVVVLVVLLRLFFKSKTGKSLFDRALLKTPIFGPLFQKIYLVRFSRSLSTLIVGGIPISSSLKIVSKVVGNTVYQNIIKGALIDVEEGRSISNAFLDEPAVPKMLPHLMAIGEQTGRIDEILGKIADFYSREVENILSKLITLLEPVILIFLAVVVGGMVIAIITPMYQLASAI
jgi:type II secretory pathway component PulF